MFQRQMRINLIITLLLIIVACLVATLPVNAAGPYIDGKFEGRIAYSADGNHNDPDDWAASPLALAIFAEAGLADRLVHFDYNCILPKTDPKWEKIHAESVLGAAQRYSYDLTRFHDCRQDVDRAVASIARAIDESSAENPLYFIVAGPMEVPYLGIQKSDPAKRKFAHCISHSRWNDGFASAYTFTNTKRSVIESGVNWVQIRDQNRLLSLSPYGKPGPPESFAPFHWMRDASEDKVRFLWERMIVSTRPDPSDAGMAYFLATGDEDCDPDKLRRLIAEKSRPALITQRKEVRLEAENFRELIGYELEDRNDRAASHRLGVRPQREQATATIRTPFSEPHSPAAGRFDVFVRFFDGPQGTGRLSLLVNGAVQGQPVQLTASDRGWSTQSFTNVAIRADDEIAVSVTGTPVRLDYVQLNLK
jgi:hypothetical protein